MKYFFDNPKFRKLGEKVFELVNHLGNILSTISDRKIMHEELPNNPGVVHHYTAEILSVQEQYAFGMNMPGRSFSVEEYRYGMNGQEKSDEIFKGALTAEFWEYDSRIGRRWNMDPIDYSWQSPYTCFNDNPFYFADPFGLEGEKVMKRDGNKAAGTKLTEEGDAWSNGNGSTSSSNNKSICYTCGANGENIYGLPPESDLGESASASPRVDGPLKNGGFKSEFSKSNFKSNFSINLANSHVKTFRAKASIVNMQIMVPELKVNRSTREDGNLLPTMPNDVKEVVVGSTLPIAATEKAADLAFGKSNGIYKTFKVLGKTIDAISVYNDATVIINKIDNPNESPTLRDWGKLGTSTIFLGFSSINPLVPIGYFLLDISGNNPWDLGAPDSNTKSQK